MRLISAREEATITARIAELEADRVVLRAQNADLLATLLTLKANGASTTKPLPKKADRVSEVIADVAGTNAALRRQLGAHARAERLKGTDENEIVKGLLHWGEDSEGAPE